MGSISLNNVEKWFASTQVVKGVDLTIEDGEFVVFVGPSGCGKSTLLRMIGGLEDISRGSLQIDGVDVTDQPPSQRGLSMVFQSYALYPHMSVRDNMGFSLKTAGASNREIDSKVMAAAETLKLTDYLHRRPKELSGGQRQRVAIGRSIVRQPTAFLFDEPLSNLDAALRVDMRYEISKLHQTLSATMIYVTHDQVEAMTLADRIVVLDAGRIIQVGTPRELYKYPCNTFVAQFIGSPKMNVMPCAVSGAAFTLEGARGGPLTGSSYRSSSSSSPNSSSSGESTQKKGTATQVGIRAEHITTVDSGKGQCDGLVEVVEYLGADTFIILDCGAIGQLSVRESGDSNLQPGQTTGLQFDPDRLVFFNAAGDAVNPS